MPHGHVLQVLVLVITKHAVLLCVLISLLVFLVLLFILLVLVLVSPLLVVLVLSVLLPLADVQLWNLDHFVELLQALRVYVSLLHSVPTSFSRVLHLIHEVTHNLNAAPLVLAGVHLAHERLVHLRGDEPCGQQELIDHRGDVLLHVDANRRDVLLRHVKIENVGVDGENAILHHLLQILVHQLLHVDLEQLVQEGRVVRPRPQVRHEAGAQVQCRLYQQATRHSHASHALRVRLQEHRHQLAHHVAHLGVAHHHRLERPAEEADALLAHALVLTQHRRVHYSSHPHTTPTGRTAAQVRVHAVRALPAIPAVVPVAHAAGQTLGELADGERLLVRARGVAQQRAQQVRHGRCAAQHQLLRDHVTAQRERPLRRLVRQGDPKISHYTSDDTTTPTQLGVLAERQTGQRRGERDVEKLHDAWRGLDLGAP